MIRGKCAKQRVTAEIITTSGERFYGENDCANPQEICPRGDMPTGVGYHLCQDICQQGSHAEVAAIAAAGDAARGAKLVLYGHTYACGDCRQACDDAGISEIAIGGDEPLIFSPGNPVRKVKGYEYPGSVVAAFYTLAGKARYVVESAAAPGMLHIFNGDQLEHAPRE